MLSLAKFTDIYYKTDLWIFDLDGTLIDSHNQIAETLAIVLENAGESISNFESIKNVIGLSLEQMLTKLNITSDKHDECIREFRVIAHELSNEPIRIFPGVIEVFDELKKRKKKIGIATNKPTDLAEKIIRNSQLGGFIDNVVGSTEFTPKPAPDILLSVMNTLKSQRALMIGDRREDFDAAYNAGIPAIIIGSETPSQITDYKKFEFLQCGSMLSLLSLFDTLDS